MESDFIAKQKQYSLRLENVEKAKKELELVKKEFKLKREQHGRHVQELENQVDRFTAIVNEVDQLIIEKDQSIERLRNELKDLMKKKECALKDQKQNKVHDYLQEIITNSNQEFKYAKDIVAKFHSLNHILKELNRKQIATQRSLIDTKSKIIQCVQEGERSIFQLKSNIEQVRDDEAKLRKEFEKHKNELKESMEAKSRKDLEFQNKKMSILHMTNIICKEMNKRVKTQNPIDQLTKIEHYLIDLNSIALALTLKDVTDERLINELKM